MLSVLGPASAAVWTPDHVVIVIEENRSSRNLVPQLTYLTGLMHDNANFTNSHAVDHPSQPNYLALFSGSTQGTGSETKRNPDGSNPIVDGHTQVGTDMPLANAPLDTPNLGAALIHAGLSFAGYSEDLPSPGFTGVTHTGPPSSDIDYQRKHTILGLTGRRQTTARSVPISCRRQSTCRSLRFRATMPALPGCRPSPSSCQTRSTTRMNPTRLRPVPITARRWMTGCAAISSPIAAGR